MKKMISVAIAFFFTLVLVCEKIYAAEAGQFYMGLEVGSTSVKGDGPKNEPAFVPNQDFRASDSTYGFHAGFQFNEWFAAELGLTDYGSASHHFKLRDDIFFLVEPNDTHTIDAKGASLSGVFSYRMTQSFSLTGLLGITAVDFEFKKSGGFSPFTGSLSQRDSFSEQGLVYGIGAKYSLNDSFGLRAEARRSEVGDFTIDLFQVGLEYNF